MWRRGPADPVLTDRLSGPALNPENGTTHITPWTCGARRGRRWRLVAARPRTGSPAPPTERMTHEGHTHTRTTTAAAAPAAWPAC